MERQRKKARPRITEAEIEEVRRLIKEGKMNLAQIGRKMNIDGSTVSKIRLNRLRPDKEPETGFFDVHEQDWWIGGRQKQTGKKCWWK